MAGKLTCVNIETTQASSVAGGSIVGADADWITSGNWRYRKKPDGTVEVQNETGGGGSLTLPAGYKPSFMLRFAVVSGAGTFLSVEVSSGGVVTPAGEAGGGVCLSFYGDQ